MNLSNPLVGLHDSSFDTCAKNAAPTGYTPVPLCLRAKSIILGFPLDSTNIETSLSQQLVPLTDIPDPCRIVDGSAKTSGAAGTKVSGLFSYEKGQGTL